MERRGGEREIDQRVHRLFLRLRKLHSVGERVQARRLRLAAFSKRERGERGVLDGGERDLRLVDDGVVHGARFELIGKTAGVLGLSRIHAWGEGANKAIQWVN